MRQPMGGAPVVLVAPVVVVPALVLVLVPVVVDAVSSAGSAGLLQPTSAPVRKASVADAVVKFVIGFTMLSLSVVVGFGG